LPLATSGRTVIDVNLCCVVADEWPEEAGGYVKYLTSDDELVALPPKTNTLTVVCREVGMMSFVRYVTAAAPEVRYDVAAQFVAMGDG